MQHRKAGITTLPTSTHHHLYPICLQSVKRLGRAGYTSSVTLSTVLSVLVESHENSSPTTFSRTLPLKTLNLAIRINRIIFQRSHLLPRVPSVPRPTKREGGLLLMFVFDFLGSSILLLLSLFGTTFKTEYQLNGRFLGNIVVYQSVVISIMIADSGMGG